MDTEKDDDNVGLEGVSDGDDGDVSDEDDARKTISGFS